MNLFKLVLVNLGRNKLRTILTMLSVMVALFLFCALRRRARHARRSRSRSAARSRLVTRNTISLVLPDAALLPRAHRGRARASRASRCRTGSAASDPDGPEQLLRPVRRGRARTIAIYDKRHRDRRRRRRRRSPVARARRRRSQARGVSGRADRLRRRREAAATKKGWKLGQTSRSRGTIFPGDWPFTIRAVYRAKNKSFGEETHVLPLEVPEREGHGRPGRGRHLRARARTTRSQAGDIAHAVDAHVRELRRRDAHRDRAGVPGRAS